MEDREHLVESRQLQHSEHRTLRADQGHPAVALVHPAQRADENAEARRIHERDAREVDQEAIGLRSVEGSEELFAKLRRGEQIDLSRDTDDGPRALGPDLNCEVDGRLLQRASIGGSVDNVGWLVTVTVPADAGVVQLLRTIVAGVGARVGLTYDSIDDLRLAAQEAVGQIMLVTGTDGSISMRVETNEHGLELRLWTERVVGAWPPPGIEGSMAWTILSTLVGDVSLDREDGAASVRLVKPLDDAGGDGSGGAA